MRCMNCGDSLTERTTDFTLRVMLCKKCAVMLSRLRDRIRSEVETLLATLDDTLRFGVTDAEAFPGGVDEKTTRDQVLRFIVSLDEKCRNTSRTTTSSKSTKPSATTASGNGSSTKLSAPGSK